MFKPDIISEKADELGFLNTFRVYLLRVLRDDREYAGTSKFQGENDLHRMVLRLWLEVNA